MAQGARRAVAPRRAVVLVSGGIDSAVALHATLAEGFEALPLTFDYHLRPARELEALAGLLAHAHAQSGAPGRGALLPLRRVALPFLREVEDMAPRPAHLAGAPEGYIPARNLVFYALAASLAEAEGAARIVGGHNGTDPELFPDAGPAFFAEVNALLRRAVWSHARSPVEVVVPLRGRGKAEVVRWGQALGVPWAHTWSCYADGKAPCGACGSCQERREAFAAAGLRDPAAP